MADLDALEDWAGPLLRKLEPAGRAKLARAVAQQLRRSQQQRIQAQRSPDGTPFTPRREHKLREKQGRVKKKAKMFQKLRTSTYLKAQGDARGLSVGFAGRIARIARVHQYGLRDRIAPRGPAAQYEKRELLGFTPADQDQLKDLVLAHLGL
ncbi:MULTISPECIES: phage virion morphogenesis protein [Pseudomonas]|uniref:phage virion morphogenesis protein n=1 Tax=Pseudomonas TaxID=286 RepID=UPI0013794F85|nr:MULTISPECIES: phage virion morphogenesis protein [Pseudomonas]MBR7520382.1 phage virion morphogenesis protein [Pseudomonas juntendi]MDM3892791.1 phage virion morphogenesis protein [Pseudomonas juntendi]WBM33147.1 phage virion morphogenesis protein [Pseudomonas sp. NY11382]